MLASCRCTSAGGIRLARLRQKPQKAIRLHHRDTRSHCVSRTDGALPITRPCPPKDYGGGWNLPRIQAAGLSS